MRHTVTIHLRSTSTAFHHPQHAIALRRLRLLPVCLPLWLQLPTPSPAPLLEPALLVTGLQTRSQSQSSFCPGPSPPLPPSPSRSPTGNQRCGCRLHCGIVVSALNRPTDRSRQTGTHLIPMSVASEQGTGTGRGGQRDVPQDRR